MKENVVSIPSVYFESWIKTLCPSSFVVFCYLHYLSARDETLTHKTSYVEMGEELGMSRQTVARAIRDLQRLDFLSKKTIKEGKVTQTVLNLCHLTQKKTHLPKRSADE